MPVPFWESKSLAELSPYEWASLCDGCGKCCLHKLEDEDSGEVYYTEVACNLLDIDQCHCNDYTNRLSLVPDCISLTPDQLDQLSWLPATCAYRLLYENKPLYSWHPLVSGDAKSVHKSGNSVRGKVLSEQSINPSDMEDHIIHWVE